MNVRARTIPALLAISVFLILKVEAAGANKPQTPNVLFILVDDQSPLAHNNLAVALYFSQQFSEAKKHMDRARELGYSVDPNFISSLEEKLG